jgi:hypothetical protein
VIFIAEVPHFKPNSIVFSVVQRWLMGPCIVCLAICLMHTHTDLVMIQSIQKIIDVCMSILLQSFQFR